MSSNQELDEMLKLAVASAKAGEIQMARDLLMRIVERDERNITAWLWLSEVSTNPDDRRICLENMLALDPNSQIARRGLELLDKQSAAPSRLRQPPKKSHFVSRSAAPTLAAAVLQGPLAPSGDADQSAQQAETYTPPSIEESYAHSDRRSPSLAAAILRPAAAPAEDEMDEAAAPAPGSHVPLPSEPPVIPRWSELEGDAQTRMGEFEDETLCPYCAEPTEVEDKKCQACGGQLWEGAPRLRKRSKALWMAVMTLGLGMLWQMFAFVSWGFFNIQPFFSDGRIATVDQFLGVYLGHSTLAPEIAAELLAVLPLLSFYLFVLGLVVQLVLIVLIYSRWRPFYWFALFLAGVNLVYGGVNALAAAQVSWQNAGSIILALLLLLLVLRLQEDFMVKGGRIFCELDRDIKSHSAYYMRGRDYARRKMWAKALIHFQRAVANAPGMIAYHLALASTYARLRRYERAALALDEAKRIAPDEAEVRRLASIIAEERARYSGVRQDN